MSKGQRRRRKRRRGREKKGEVLMEESTPNLYKIISITRHYNQCSKMHQSVLCVF